MKFVRTTEITLFEVTHPHLEKFVTNIHGSFDPAKAEALCAIADLILDTLKDNDAAKQGVMGSVFPGFRFWDSQDRHILYKALGSFRKNWNEYRNADNMIVR